MRWAPEGDRLVAGYLDNVLTTYDPAADKPVASVAGYPRMTNWLFDLTADGSAVDLRSSAESIYLWRAKTGDPVLSITLFPEGGQLVVSPEGHYRASPGIEKDLVYAVLTDKGEQLMLSPAEFAKKYGWKNDPEKVSPKK